MKTAILTARHPVDLSLTFLALAALVCIAGTFQ
jgi:hypothetical protein